MFDARALLARYQRADLLEELEALERQRAVTVAPAYEVPAASAKTLIFLDGVPGAGKSTAQRWLQSALGAAYFSLARFAEARGVSADDRRLQQLSTGQPHPVDEAFLEALAASDARFLLIEKFARSVVEAAMALSAARRFGWRLEVLHFQLPGDCVAFSAQRQVARGPRHGRTPEPDYARFRALVHLARATSGRELLRARAVPIHAIDTTRAADENVRDVRRALGLEVEALRWFSPHLETLARVAREVGVDAWLAGGNVYRPFWNNRFGPTQRPTDADVAVEEERAVTPLLEALQRAAPEHAWSVLAPSSRVRERLGLEANSAAEAKTHAVFLHRGGLVRLREGAVELRLAPGTEAALWSGRVALNSALFERLPEARREEVIARDLHHAPRVLKEYPGLQVDAATRAMLEGRAGWVHHAPVPILARFEQLKARVIAQRPPRRAEPHQRRRPTPVEHPVVAQVLEFQRAQEKSPQAPEVPVSRAPESTLEVVAQHGTDAEFSSWVLAQLRHHRPPGGRDPYLRGLLDFSLFGAPRVAGTRTQSAMHQGWALERHLVHAAAQLDTRGLSSAERLAARLTMLFHDTGKWVTRAQTRHPLISARLFTRFRPAWFPGALVPLTQWLIRTHDLFGALGQWLTAPLTGHYDGGLDADAVRRRLLDSGLSMGAAVTLHRRVWEADVGSVAALRWLRPMAALLQELVLLRPPRRAAAERRSPLEQ